MRRVFLPVDIYLFGKNIAVDTFRENYCFSAGGIFPFDITEGIEPIYAELPGWKCDMTKMKSEEEFPEEFNGYISFLEDYLGTPIKIVSVGPDREQTIERYTEE